MTLPDETKPVMTQPVQTQPVVTQPVVTQPVVTQPVVRSRVQQTGAGWVVQLSLPETAREVSYRVGDFGEFISTGYSDTLDVGRTGVRPNLSILLPFETGETMLHIQYVDRRGRERGPFELPFRPPQRVAPAPQ